MVRGRKCGIRYRIPSNRLALIRPGQTARHSPAPITRCRTSLACVVFRWMIVKRQSVALVVALAVFSHWVLDLITHTPDLPLWTDDSTKVGLGLWNNAALTLALEAIFLITALWIYLRDSRASSSLRKYGMAIFVALLISMISIQYLRTGSSRWQS